MRRARSSAADLERTRFSLCWCYLHSTKRPKVHCYRCHKLRWRHKLAKIIKRFQQPFENGMTFLRRTLTIFQYLLYLINMKFPSFGRRLTAFLNFSRFGRRSNKMAVSTSMHSVFVVVIVIICTAHLFTNCVTFTAVQPVEIEYQQYHLNRHTGFLQEGCVGDSLPDRPFINKMAKTWMLTKRFHSRFYVENWLHFECKHQELELTRKIICMKRRLG